MLQMTFFWILAQNLSGTLPLILTDATLFVTCAKYVLGGPCATRLCYSTLSLRSS